MSIWYKFECVEDEIKSSVLLANNYSGWCAMVYTTILINTIFK